MCAASPHDSQTVDTVINVAQLLKQPAGATRRYQVAVATLPLGEERVARHLGGPIKITRVGPSLLLTGVVTGETDVTCVRCLTDFTTQVTLELEDEFRPSIDVASGFAVTYPAGDGSEADETDYFLIDENHEMDLSEMLRQAVWVVMPMMPICREDCPGLALAEPPAAPSAAEEAIAAEPADARLAVLRQLLEAMPPMEADRPTAPTEPPAAGTPG